MVPDAQASLLLLKFKYEVRILQACDEVLSRMERRVGDQIFDVQRPSRAAASLLRILLFTSRTS